MRLTNLLVLFIITITFSFGISAQRKSSVAKSKPTIDKDFKEFVLPLEKQQKLRVAENSKAASPGLLKVFTKLLPSQKRKLGPLTKAERKELEPAKNKMELNQKIGVVRAIEPDIKVRRLTRTAAGVQDNKAKTFSGGRVETANGGLLLYTVEISSAGATGIRVEIQNINLPSDAQIFLTDGENQIEGPYTFPAPVTESFWTNTIFASRVPVQVQIPASSAERAANAFTISSIAHIEEEVAHTGLVNNEIEKAADVATVCSLVSNCRPNPFPSSPTTEQNIAETASLGVAHINYVKNKKVYICSGGLLADRAGSSTPFFLTANHCFNTQASATSLEAYFRFRRVCGEAVPKLSTLPKTLGSTLLATSTATDFTLVRLSQPPPAGSHFFNWSIDDISDSTTTMYRIHHPDGYSQHFQRSSVRRSGGCASPRGRFLYSNPQNGGTMGGSSGSLTFRVSNGALEVVGQLFGACPNTSETCDYSNIDGAFASTYPTICKFLVTDPSTCPTTP